MPGAMSRLSPEQEIEALQALRLRLHRVEPPRPLRDARAAAAFVRERGIVMETGSSGLPVLAEAIVGRQIRGSWMADRDVYRIHRILTGTRRRGVVAAPIVMGKETLFVPALGPAIERVAGDPARRRQARDALPPLSRRLLDDVERNGEVRMDRWPRSAVQARRARLLLVRQLLVWSQSIHTEGGYHTAVVIPWRAAAAACGDTFCRRGAGAGRPAMVRVRLRPVGRDARCRHGPPPAGRPGAVAERT